MAWLAVGMTTRELREGEGDILVGCGLDAHWRVATVDLMPAHFLVSVRGGSATVRSSSGDIVVVVNGTQIADAPHPLREGDVILAGSGRFMFTLDSPIASPVDEPPTPHGYLIDDQARVAHPLLTRSTPIGRDASNAIVVRDPTASRFHAEVRREAGGFALRSIGATGTTLNSKTLATPSMLAEGDTVELAFARFRFTAGALTGDISLAKPHSTTNDEAGRKPTLAAGSEVIVDETNEAGRDTRRIQFMVALIVALAVLGWIARSAG